MSTMLLEQNTMIGDGLRRPSLLAYCIYVEIVKILRVPMFTFFSLLFPTFLFALVGLPNVAGQADGNGVGKYLMASFGAYAVLMISFFSFGVAIASERGMGWYKLLRATSLSPLTLFLAKTVMALMFALAAMALLFAFGALVGHTAMPLTTWLGLLGLLLLGMIPFVALGLFLGYFVGPNSAPVVANLVVLPLSFLSGLFVPIPQLPGVMQRLAPYLPSYHLGQLGWTLMGLGDGQGMLAHLAWLAGYTVLFFTLAIWAYKRDENKTFG